MKAFLDGLEKETKAKVYAALQMLGQEGNRLRMPRYRGLGQGVFELRIPHPQGPFRIIYCFEPGRCILLLHAFTKRTEKTPPEDLKLARDRKPK